MKVELADIKAQHKAIEPEILATLADVFTDCRFILGPNVTALEQEIAALSGVRFAAGVNSGTDALLIALAALDIKPGDEVITTPFTFVATVETVCQLGATPVFADIDLDTFNIDPAEIEKKITPKTRAIMPVHLFGQLADVETINAIGQKHGIPVIGDGAQAIGASRNGVPIGQTAALTTLSFYPTKNLGGCGDGGMVLTDDEKLYEQIKLLRFHGSGGGYIYKRIGYCSRLDEIQAAVLRIKLKRLAAWNNARKANAARYISKLSGVQSVILPKTDPGNDHIYHQFTVRVAGGAERRDALKAHLASHEIGSAVFYPRSLHLMGPYTEYGAKPGDLPNSERATSEVLSLPVHPDLTAAQVDFVADTIASFK
ncbi:MAG: DegT/DnrJ/EryC1/StrS family aminotransferase [Capsulimonadaceae bacterium]|nr:DegT/DnrJ/EryC1/StrS family aminotransferase [Capsulimonadaceae bacterium]